jgi:hypothetical protein
MVFNALFNQQQQSQGESPYARLLEDPKFALGYGLLTSRENPLGAAVQVMGQGETAKQARKQNEIQNMLLQAKLQKSMGNGSAFAGTSMDAQAANLAYQDALNQGMDDFSARKYAADKIRTSRMDLRINPQTGTLDSIPRSPIFGNTATPIQPNTQPPQQPDYTPSSWDEIYSEPVADMNNGTGKKLGESLAKTSGLLQQGQMALRGITAPIDQLIKETTGYNSNMSGAVGGEGLAGADKAINLFIEGAVADMMVGRSVDEQKRKRDLYSPKSPSQEGALEKLTTIVDDLQSQTDAVQRQIDATTNINDKTKLRVKQLIPLQKRLNEGRGAMQYLQQAIGGGGQPQNNASPIPSGGRFLGFE